MGKRQGKGDKLTDGQAAGPRGQSGRLEPTGKSGGCLRGKSGGNVKMELRLPSEEMSGLAWPSARVAPTGKSGGGLPGEHGGNVKRELRLASEEMS